jgi:hypothetical protein
MNEQLLEYIRLREHVRQLHERQGEQTWCIIERVIRDINTPTPAPDPAPRRRQLQDLIGRIDLAGDRMTQQAQREQAERNR